MNNKTVKKRSAFASAMHRFMKNKLSVLGLIIFIFLVFVSLTADFFFDYEEQAIAQNIMNRYQGFSGEHFFGTDQYGRDMFVRIVFGARISLIIGLSASAVAIIAGSAIGSIAGYFGGRVDGILMRVMDVFLAIPNMLLAICLVASMGSNIPNLIIASAVAQTPKVARLVRGNVMQMKNSEFVEAARITGAKTKHIITKHILPNTVGIIIVQATIVCSFTMLSVASLSFIGLGIAPPTPEWGSMLAQGKEFMRLYPHLVMVPGFAIMFAVLGVNLIGDGLRDALDPRLKN